MDIRWEWFSNFNNFFYISAEYFGEAVQLFFWKLNNSTPFHVYGAAYYSRTTLILLQKYALNQEFEHRSVTEHQWEQKHLEIVLYLCFSNLTKIVIFFSSNLVSVNVTVLILISFMEPVLFFSFQADFFTLLMGGRSGFKFDNEDNYRLCMQRYM